MGARQVPTRLAVMLFFRASTASMRLLRCSRVCTSCSLSCSRTLGKGHCELGHAHRESSLRMLKGVTEWLRVNCKEAWSEACISGPEPMYPVILFWTRQASRPKTQIHSF